VALAQNVGVMVPLVGNRPLYVPTKCPPVEEYTTIIKKWAMKIEGPAPLPNCGGGGEGAGMSEMLFGPGMGFLGGLAAAIPTPLDWLFGGQGVHGCLFPGATDIDKRDCGPCFGPLPNAIATVPRILAAPTTIFGALW
jgi:hypothetical protein